VRALRVKLAIGVAVLGSAAVGAVAVAGDRSEFGAHLNGWAEVPVVVTDGKGSFRARLAPDSSTVEWELSYAGLSTPVQQAHIHVGQRRVNGGISVFLCTNLGNAPAGVTVQACPPEGRISGTFASGDVVGPAAQGIAPGELADLLRAMRAGVTYANVHTEQSPAGEIRGQVPRGEHDD
jgi:hypothetical protein